jgi:hypothetical protein
MTSKIDKLSHFQIKGALDDKEEKMYLLRT